jgi:hypothetical protein
MTTARQRLKFIGIAIATNLLFDVALLIAMATVEAKIDLNRSKNAMYIRLAAEGFVLGCLISQLVALAVWTALFTGANSGRLLLGTMALTCGVFSLSALARAMHLQGYYLRANGDATDIWQTTAVWLFAILAFYVVQIPLWMLRAVWQMRIVRERAEWMLPANQQISLLQIFGITSYFAVVMALTRVEGPIPHLRDASRAVLAITVLSVGIGMPYLWAILGTKRVIWGIVAIGLMSEAFVYVGSRLYMHAVTAVAPADWPYVVVAFRGAQFGTLLIGIRNGLAARTAGYRLMVATAWKPHGFQEPAALPSERL